MLRIKIIISSTIFVFLTILIEEINSLRWEDEDSIVVEGGWRQRNSGKYQSNWPWLETRSRSDSADELTCYTTLGEQGYCADIRQCYPSVFSDTSEKFEDQNMLETLKSLAGPCDTSHFNNFRVELPDGLICCTNRPPPTQATSPPTSSTPSTTTSKIDIRIPGQSMNLSFPTSTEKLFVPDAVAAFLYDQRLPTCGYLNNTIHRDEKRFPWIVALISGHGHFCAGSLIDRYHVLTAAQCVNQLTTEDIKNMRVYLGDYKLHTTSDGPAVIRKVARIIYHRSFNKQTLKNDVALLKFRLPAPTGTPKVLPICLPNQKKRFEVDDKNFGVKATLAGWGRSWNPTPTPILRKTLMTVWSNENCRTKYGYLAKNGIADNMLCAAADNKGRSEITDCIGDSGGPLSVTGDDEISRQIGIVSWNIGCGNYPYVYTRVSSFIPWIEKNIRRR